MLNRTQLSVLLLVAAAVWGVTLLFQGVTVQTELTKPFSVVVGVVAALLSAFNLWLWKVPLFRGWLVKRPVLEGTWDVTIRSTWKDPSTGETAPPIAGFMAVTQTYADLHMRLMTKESHSVMLAADLLPNPDGTYALVGIYRNVPNMGVRHRSPIHHGGLLLEVESVKAKRVIGTYWTDRGTAGDIALDGRRGKVFRDYDSAARRARVR
jgi:predicted pore-forming effector associated with SMODS systems